MGNRESSFSNDGFDVVEKVPSWDHAWTVGQTLLVTAFSICLVACCFRGLKARVARSKFSKGAKFFEFCSQLLNKKIIFVPSY